MAVCMLACVALTFVPLGAAANDAIQGWTYSTSAVPLGDEWTDTTPSKLSDGDLSPNNSVILGRGTVVLDIALPGLCRLTGLRAHVYRHNMNYRLGKLLVEAERFGRWELLGEAAGFWAPTEERQFTLEVGQVDAETERLRLSFVTGGGIVSIQEIEILGQRVTQAAAASDARFRIPPAPGPGLGVRELDADGDEKPDLVLENDLVRLVLLPSRGGVCASLVVKQNGDDLTAPPSSNMGLFRDQLWEPPYIFADRFYAADQGGDDRARWVELRTTGAGGMLSFTDLRKRIGLQAGDPVVRVEWELRNNPSSQTEYVYGPWFHHFTGVEGHTNTYFFPTEDGVRDFVLPVRGEPSPKAEEWFHDPSRPWTAVVADDGTGLAFTMEYKYLNCFYHWAGKTSTTATHEWRFNKISLPPGEALKTEYQVTPFVGLTRVDGVAPGVVGQVETPEDGAEAVAATVFLAAGQPGGELALQVRQWPAGEWKVAGRKATAEPQPGALGSLTTIEPDEPLPPGAHELRVVLARGDARQVVAERPFATEGVRMAYHMEPPEPRVGLTEKAASKPGHDLEMSVPSPHFPWARPYAGGELRALVLVDDRNCREVIELAQRVDLDFTYVKFYSTLDTEWKYHGDLSIQTLAQAQERLAGELESSFDVIVIAGLKWDHHFTPEIRQRIEEMVAAGTGLVYIEPEGFSQEDLATWPMMGVAKDKPMNAWHGWESTADHAVTTALPWELMPRTRRMTYDPAPHGEVLASFDDGEPLLVASQTGKGRVLTLTYDTLTHAFDYRGYSALTPLLSYRGGYLLDEFKALHHPYWELWYALLARCVTWASSRETGCTIRDFQPLQDVMLNAEGRAENAPALACTLGGAFRPMQGAVRWRIVDKLGGERLDVTEKADLAPGTSLSRPLPLLLPGTSLAFVKVMDEAGNSLAWAASHVEAQAPAGITELTTTADILVPKTPDPALPAGDTAWRQWSPAEPLDLTVGLDIVRPAPAGLQVCLDVYDTHGRQLVRAEKPAPGDADRIGFTVPLADLVNSGLEAVVELRTGDRVLDRAEKRFIAPRPRVWDRFSFTSWNGQYLWRSYYLFDLVASRVEETGLDYALNGTYEYDSGKVWNDYWHNIGHSDLGLLSAYGREVPGFVDGKFSDKAKSYAETGDEQFLVREPCLNDLAWRESILAAIRERVEGRLPYGGCYDYCMGDEMSLTYYTRYFDYCWSEHCLGRFREWLQDRYGGLAELNAAWGTDFGAWDQVEPLTLKQAREAENPASWADHRSFMNDVLAGFFGDVQATIEAVDPGAKAGLSGTQSPEAGNGMDWWKLSQAFTYYHSYNTSWSSEMRRSFQREAGVSQSPYYLGYWQAGRKVEYNGFWCLLHDTKGISAWTTPLFFYGDLTLSECGASTRDLVAEMKDGIWDLIREAERQHDGIAILYSQESVNAAALLDQSPALNDSRDAWVKIVEDLGLQYEFVSPEQIADGILESPADRTSGDFRVCILPMAIALSPAEATALSSFVEQGGTVIADRDCGLTDDRCRGLRPGALDELFGITREQAVPGAELGITTTQQIGGIPANSEVLLTVAEPGLRLNGGVASATSKSPQGVPAIVRRDVGEGHAFYLNLDLTQFEAERRFHSPTEVHIRQIVASALEAAGAERRVVVTFGSGRPPHVEVVRYRDGDLEYVGLLRMHGSEEPETALVSLPGKSVVYDVRQHRELGQVDSLRVPMEAGEARVFCLAPAPLPAPSLRVSSSAAAGERIEAVLGVPAAASEATRVLRLRVSDPSGKPVPAHQRNVLLRSGEATVRLPTALNDPTGEWRIAICDLVSGAVVEDRVEVRPGT